VIYAIGGLIVIGLLSLLLLSGVAECTERIALALEAMIPGEVEMDDDDDD